MKKALYLAVAGMITAKNIAHDFKLRRLDKTNVAFDVVCGVCWLPIFVIANGVGMLQEMGFLDLNNLSFYRAKKELEECNFGEAKDE